MQDQLLQIIKIKRVLGQFNKYEQNIHQKCLANLLITDNFSELLQISKQIPNHCLDEHSINNAVPQRKPRTCTKTVGSFHQVLRNKVCMSPFGTRKAFLACGCSVLYTPGSSFMKGTTGCYPNTNNKDQLVYTVFSWLAHTHTLFPKNQPPKIGLHILSMEANFL